MRGLPAAICGSVSPFRLLTRDYFKSPGCFSKQDCRVLAARMLRWFLCSVAQLHNITSFQMASYWTVWR